MSIGCSLSFVGENARIGTSSPSVEAMLMNSSTGHYLDTG